MTGRGQGRGFTVQPEDACEVRHDVSAGPKPPRRQRAQGRPRGRRAESEDFSSLSAGSYVIYSGVYDKKPKPKGAPGPEEELPARP